MEEVWAFLMQPSNFLLWSNTLTAVEASDGLNQGSQVTFSSRSFGRLVTTKGEITHNDGNSFKLHSKSGPIKVDACYRLEAKGQATTLTLDSSFETNNFFHLAESLVQSMSNTNSEASLASLKQFLEARADQNS